MYVGDYVCGHDDLLLLRGFFANSIYDYASVFSDVSTG